MSIDVSGLNAKELENELKELQKKLKQKKEEEKQLELERMAVDPQPGDLVKWVESQPMIHVARMSNKRADFRAAMRFPGKLTKFVTAYDEDDNVVELDSANIHHINIDDYDCVSHKVLKTYGYSLEEIEMIKDKV